MKSFNIPMLVTGGALLKPTQPYHKICTRCALLDSIDLCSEATLFVFACCQTFGSLKRGGMVGMLCDCRWWVHEKQRGAVLDV